jgi:hypothetical protein
MSRTIFDRPSAPVIFLNEERSGNICFESGDPGTDQLSFTVFVATRPFRACLFTDLRLTPGSLPFLALSRADMDWEHAPLRHCHGSFVGVL